MEFNGEFAKQFIWVLLFFCLVFFVVSLWRYRTLPTTECNHMTNLYPKLNTHIRAIPSKEKTFQHPLFDYYVQTAYNACSGGAYQNDYVDLCSLKAVLRQGVRGIDLAVYSVDGQAVVATSASSNYHTKQTFNSIPFHHVFQTLIDYAFSSGTAPNASDPLLLHLRIYSDQSSLLEQLADVFEDYSMWMLGKEYSFEKDHQNMGGEILSKLCNRIVIIVDRENPAVLAHSRLMEFVNLTSGSVFMRSYSFSEIQQIPDRNELIEYNRTGLSLVTPERTAANPDNPLASLCRGNGCQMIAMRYQWVDSALEENANFFDTAGYAFVLKPDALRYHPVVVAPPQKQDKSLSYETRQVKSDYYHFQV